MGTQSATQAHDRARGPSLDGPVLVGIDGPGPADDAVALGHRLAELLGAPLDTVAASADALAANEDAAVIVIGTRHRRHLARVLHGSPRQLLRRTQCPVAVAPPGFAGRPPAAIRRIGVGFEPTPVGEAALAVAHQLAARSGASLRAIGVALPLAPLAIDDARDQTPYLHEERRLVRAGLERALGALPEGVPTVVDARIGSPGAELVAAADDLDLLVCGSRRRGALRTMLLGSVTERLLADAACPVLVVPVDP